MRRRNTKKRGLLAKSTTGSEGLAELTGIALSEVLEPLLRLLHVMGVSRSEVLGLVRKIPIVRIRTPVRVVRGRLEYWSRAVTRWASDPRFLGTDGRPRDLAFSIGEPSFSTLVALALPRERADLCRDILLATGAIIRLPGGKLRWRERAALAHGAESGFVLADEYLRPLRALLLALQTNLLRRAKGTQPIAFQMGVSGFEISQEDMSELHRFVDRHGTAFLETVDDWISNRVQERQRNGDFPSDPVRPYLGLYLCTDSGRSRIAPRMLQAKARAHKRQKLRRRVHP